MVVEIVEMDDEELGQVRSLFLMMSWKKQVSRGTKCCLKKQNYVIRKN
jgi:hypothetical protein